MKTTEIRKACSLIEDRYIIDSVDFIDRRRRKRAGRFAVVMTCVAAVLLAAAACTLVFAMRGDKAPRTDLPGGEAPAVREPAATLYIDADRSFAISVDADKTVMSVRSVDNGDALTPGGNIVGKPLDEAIEKIVSACVEKGYSVMVTFKSRDEIAEEWLKKDLGEQDNLIVRYQPEEEDAPSVLLDEETAYSVALQITGLVNDPGATGEATYREESNTYRVSIRSSFGVEYRVTIAAENKDLLVSWQSEEFLGEDAINEIVNKDLGSTDGRSQMYGGGLDITLVVCEAGYKGECVYNYLISSRTGEILYKETVDGYDMVSGEFSAYAAILTEKNAGKETVEIVAVEDISDGAPQFLVTLQSDGETVVRRVLNGVVSAWK